MKILILNSSPRKNGNTARLSSLIADSYAKSTQTVDVEIINLADYTIHQCCGCRLCFNKGEAFCPQKDDVLTLYYKMKEKDLLIWAFPVYVEDLNGLLKNFIDRLAFNCHRPGLFAQSSFAYSNSGSGSSKHAIKTIERASQTWGMKLLGHRKCLLGSLCDKETLLRKYGALIDKDTQTCVAALSKAKKNLSFLQVLTFDIQKWYYLNKIDQNSYDFLYWKNQGWLDKSSHYYTKDPIPAFFKICSKGIGFMIINMILR